MATTNNPKETIYAHPLMQNNNVIIRKIQYIRNFSSYITIFTYLVHPQIQINNYIISLLHQPSLELHYNFLPLEITNPPKTVTASSENVPNVLATTISLPNAAINRNNADAI